MKKIKDFFETISLLPFVIPIYCTPSFLISTIITVLTSSILFKFFQIRDTPIYKYTEDGFVNSCVRIEEVRDGLSIHFNETFVIIFIFSIVFFISLIIQITHDISYDRGQDEGFLSGYESGRRDAEREHN
jgi:hypothetical protein